MSDPARRMISDLTRDLSPVRRLPRLPVVAAAVVGASLALALAGLLAWGAAGHAMLKPGLGLFDALVVSGHLALASGALILALASCVPGRESLERIGGWVLGAGGLVTLLGIAVLLRAPAPAPAVGSFAACTLVAVVPALVPAALLASFAGRGAPHRPWRTLAFAALSVVGFGTLAGHLGCPNSAALHLVMGHLIAPFSGGALVFAALRLLYRPALPRIRA